MLDKKYLDLKSAVNLLLKHINQKFFYEVVPIEKAYNRITYENIYASEDLPGFRRSSVDGFAVRSQGTFGAKETMLAYLTIKGCIQMGVVPNFSLDPGIPAEIATGGMLPKGADAVIMMEHINIISPNLI